MAKSTEALAEAMQTLQQTEAKLKAMEAEFNRKEAELEELRQHQGKQVISPSRVESNDATCQTSDSGNKLTMLEQQVS